MMKDVSVQLCTASDFTARPDITQKMAFPLIGARESEGMESDLAYAVAHSLLRLWSTNPGQCGRNIS
jgi:protein involved in ribonucleotide reduction